MTDQLTIFETLNIPELTVLSFGGGQAYKGSIQSEAIIEEARPHAYIRYMRSAISRLTADNIKKINDVDTTIIYEILSKYDIKDYKYWSRKPLT